MKLETQTLVGCSGFAYSSWRGNFYPADATYPDMFPIYASRFPTVEVNGAYYGLLSRKTLKSWLEMAPEGFYFSLKVPRHLVEVPDPAESARTWSHLEDLTALLLSKDAMGALLFQVPCALEYDLKRLESLVESPLSVQVDRVFDFHHPSWFRNEVYDYLADHGCDIAAVSRPDSEPFVQRLATFKYFRLSGEKREGRSDYAFKELEAWGKRITEAAKGAERIYVYFNNTGKGCAPINASAFVHRILKR